MMALTAEVAGASNKLLRPLIIEPRKVEWFGGRQEREGRGRDVQYCSESRIPCDWATFTEPEMRRLNLPSNSLRKIIIYYRRRGSVCLDQVNVDYY
jgi:hypothetical protein